MRPASWRGPIGHSRRAGPPWQGEGSPPAPPAESDPTVPAARPSPPHPTRPARETVSCAGYALTIEVFAPGHKDADTTPAIILLHDAHGAGPDRPVRAEAACLAAAGFRGILPPY